MPNTTDSPSVKSRKYRETARINSRLAVEAHKRGDTRERDFQLSMRKYNNEKAGKEAEAFGRSVRAALDKNTKIDRRANKYKKKY